MYRHQIDAASSIGLSPLHVNRPLLPPPTLRQRSIGGSGTGLAHTFRAHAVSGIGKLSRNLFHQNCMIPTGAVALDEVFAR